MIKINFPEPAFRFKKDQGKEWIFDDCRKQYTGIQRGRSLDDH